MQAMLVLYLVTATGSASGPLSVAQYPDMDSCKAAATAALVIEKPPGTKSQTVFICAPTSGIDLPRR